MKLIISNNMAHKQVEVKELMLKALKNIDDYELSEFDWVREYQEALIKYVEDVIQAVGIGVSLMLDVDPTNLHKSFRARIPYDILLKAANDEPLPDFYKSLFDKLRTKFSTMAREYQKFRFNKGKPLEPLKFGKKIIYNAETGKAITNEQFISLADDIGKFIDSKMGNVGDMTILRAALMGKMMQQMEREGTPLEKQKRMSWKDVEERFGPLPDTEDEAKDKFDLSAAEMNAIRFAKAKAGEYLSIHDGTLRNQVTSAVRNQIVQGLQDGLDAQEVAQRLFWMDPRDEKGRPVAKDTLEEYNRNWRRVAITEMKSALSNGYLSAHKEEARSGEKIYFVFSGRYNPKEAPRGPNSCNQFLGKICLLVDRPLAADSIDDEYAEFAIWIGKTNVGRGKDTWCCIPVHPHCTHHWERAHPDVMEWDPEINKMVFKVNKSFKKEEMDLIKNDEVQKKVKYEGLNIDIEWEKGTTRHWKGSSYRNHMHADYGYIINTNSPDGEEIDVYLNNPPQPDAKVFMLSQLKQDGNFDEHKFMLGFPNAKTAQNVYVQTMPTQMFGGIVEMTLQSFKKDMVKFYQKKNLKKSDVHIDNIEWKEKRGALVQEELTAFAKEAKDFLRMKNPIIVHLYKGNDGDRGEYDEGVILLYENTPDWRGDFCHELGHQLIRQKTIDNDPICKVKLQKIKRAVEKTKGDGRVFVQEHTYSNIKEVAVTFFKWWLLGNMIDDAYLKVLRFYQPEAEGIIKRLMKNDYIQKSIFERDNRMFFKSSFVSTPRNKRGQIDYRKVPLGASLLVRISGHEIPVKRVSENEFIYDSHLAKSFEEGCDLFSEFEFAIDKYGRPEEIGKKVKFIKSKERNHG